MLKSTSSASRVSVIPRSSSSSLSRHRMPVISTSSVILAPQQTRECALVAVLAPWKRPQVHTRDRRGGSYESFRVTLHPLAELERARNEQKSKSGDDGQEVEVHFEGELHGVEPEFVEGKPGGEAQHPLAE